MSYDDQIEHTFPENWPDPVLEMSLISDVVELTGQDRFALASSFVNLREEFNISVDSGFSDDLKNIFAELLNANPEGLFVKTSYGMFKQNPFAYAPLYLMKDFNSNVRWPDSRIERYLRNRLLFQSPMFLVISPFQNIPPWSEFRLFIRDRKLIGISQYHHQEAYPEIQENLEAIKASLIPFSRQLIDALHMDTVVADVFVEQQADDSFKTTLIELNPFIQRTDPCLYSWKNGGDFDGGIRYRKLRYNPYRNTTSAGRSAEPLGLFREEDYRRH